MSWHIYRDFSVGCSSSVLIILPLLHVSAVHADLLVVLLEGGHVLPSLRELSLLHALTHVPVDKGSLGVHQVKLVIKPGPGLGDGGGVGKHADSSLDLGEVTSGDNGGWLVVDSYFEASWTPIHKLNSSFALDGGDGCVDILRDNVAPVEHAAGHVLAMTGVALHHRVHWLKAGVGNLSHGELFVVSLFSRDDRSVGDKRKMDPGIRHQVCLELVEVNIEGSIESKRSGDGRDNLRDEAIEVCVRGPLDVQVPPANVVDGLVVHHEGTVRMLQGGMGTQGRVVGLHNGSCNLGSGVDGEFELGFLPIVHRKTLHQERSETRASSTSKGMENEESL